MAKKSTPPPQAQRFAGVFDPPALGADASPFRVAGPGHLEFGVDALGASGFEPTGAGWRSLGFVLAVAVVAGGVTWARTTWFPDASMIVVGVIAAVAGIALYRLLMTGHDHHPQRPVRMQFPWTSVVRVQDDVRGRGCLMVHIDEGTLRGTLHFRADLSAESVRTAFRRREITVK